MAKKEIDKYVKLTQKEHILLRSGMYIGNTNTENLSLYVANDNFSKIEKKNIDFNAGFIKLFDEILTNASDHCIRTNGKVKNIYVNIDTITNSISVKNDGPGIPIEKKDGTWIPQMIFSELMTGENYDDSQERFVGGLNGYGSKLVNIFSKSFIIECTDSKKLYIQECSNNLNIINEPIISSYNKSSYTKITYITDLERFNLNNISEEHISFIRKRCMDIAVYTKCNVFFNDVLIPVKSLTDYAKMHLNEDAELYTEIINDKWEIALSQSFSNNFEQCSIVNGISTYKGGTHVDSIMNSIVKRLTEDLTKGNKGIKIRPNDIKNSFHIFLVCKIANPTFDTQSKENLTLKITDKVDLSDKLYKTLLKSDIIKSILEWVQMKEQMELNKMNKKVAGKTIRVNKLVDAHKAGTNDGYKSSIFLCEGDSAANGALRGLSIVGRDYYGIFPLKGKPLNVRNAKTSKITDNEEISNILQIIGLIPGKKYTDLSELRYGKIIFMTDSDLDGYSIKGLLINLIHKMWPELLELGFCYEFITPIVISKKGKDIKEYYDINKYKDDKEKGKLNGWYSKYYKGLGTITPEEMKLMFKNLDKHLIKFNYIKERDNDTIDKIFNTNRVQDRKDWLLTYKGDIVPVKTSKINEINDFVDLEFIQFSNGDNIRSIPQLVDGLKPSQRKIMYAAFKKLNTNKKDEVKVAQFGAYVAEQTHYNHGEMSLGLAIVGLAQDFINSNNINLLMPSGEFASRNNPSASASTRYIFTYLNTLTEKIFRKEDDIILNYLDEDGYQIEPELYYPIIPVVLLNGATGIGTGWSTDIPKYDPNALIEVIKRKITKPDIKYKINPWYKDFIGDINFNDEKGCYISKGIFNKNKKGCTITELPIDTWTENYTKFLDKLCDDKVIKNYIDNSTDININIDIIFNNDCKWTDEIIETKLRLCSNINITNMHTLVDTKIVKWNTAEDLLDYWFNIRLEKYEIRKEKYIQLLTNQLNKQKFIYAFIESIINGDLVVNKKTKDKIIKDLEEMEFGKYDDSYDYLLNVPVYWFSKEKLDSIKDDILQRRTFLKEYKNMSSGDIWINELDELKKELKKSGY